MEKSEVMRKLVFKADCSIQIHISTPLMCYDPSDTMPFHNSAEPSRTVPFSAVSLQHTTRRYHFYFHYCTSFSTLSCKRRRGHTVRSTFPCPCYMWAVWRTFTKALVMGQCCDPIDIPFWLPWIEKEKKQENGLALSLCLGQ